MTDVPIRPIEVTPTEAYYEKLLPRISAITDYVVPKSLEEIEGEQTG